MKVFFPKYINNNKLLYKLEYDEWLVIIVSFFGTFYLLAFFLMFNIIIAFIISYFVTRSIINFYIKIYKKKSPGYLFHFFYDYGFAKPSGKDEDKKDIKFPYGYETEFKN